MRTDKVTFNLHTFHNPDCDILEYQLDKDTNITYGVYVKPAIRWRGPVGLPIQIGDEFMEIYSGENYVVGSKKRSHSRCYSDISEIPKKHLALWQQLKNYYLDCKENGKLAEMLETGRFINNLTTIDIVAKKLGM